jgi:hypothetical protein
MNVVTIEIKGNENNMMTGSSWSNAIINCRFSDGQGFDTVTGDQSERITQIKGSSQLRREMR